MQFYIILSKNVNSEMHLHEQIARTPRLSSAFPPSVVFHKYFDSDDNDYFFVGEPFYWLPTWAAVESRPYIIKIEDGFNLDYVKPFTKQYTRRPGPPRLLPVNCYAL